MNHDYKYSIGLTALIAGLTVPGTVSAGLLDKMEAQCQCLTAHATLGQIISLGVMLVLLAGIGGVKWMYRKKPNAPVPNKPSNSNDSALKNLKQLKIGARFSNWSDIRRLTGRIE
jgi:hypothetical protein